MRITHDPLTDPIAGDRILIRREGTPRIVVQIEHESREVVWRWLGGQVRHRSSLSEWRSDAEGESVVGRGVLSE